MQNGKKKDEERDIVKGREREKKEWENEEKYWEKYEEGNLERSWKRRNQKLWKRNKQNYKWLWRSDKKRKCIVILL